MIRFLIRRVAFGVITLWVIVSLVFLLYYVAPHDPARNLAGKDATLRQLAAIRRSLGLDLPLWDQ